MLSEFLKESYQRKFTVFGIIGGLVAAILLAVAGVAAAPFTAGASLLPAWLGASLFFFTVVGGFASAASYIGKAVDTFVDGREKINNERLATVAGCVFGAVLSVLAVPLNFVPIAWLATASLQIWQAALVFVPLTIGMFASACSYIGRGLDALTKERTILNFGAWLKSLFVKQEIAEGYLPLSSTSTQKIFSSTSSLYLDTSSDDEALLTFDSVDFHKPVLKRSQSAPDLRTLYNRETSFSFTK